MDVYHLIKQNIHIEDIQYEINKKIVQKLYEEFEKGNSNINSIIDNLNEDEQNQITTIMMTDDYEIDDIEKAIDDILQSYEKEKLNSRKMEILGLLESDITEESRKELERELSNIIVNLAKSK